MRDGREGREGSRIGWRENSGWNVVSVETSADPAGNHEDEIITLQSCSKLG